MTRPESIDNKSPKAEPAASNAWANRLWQALARLVERLKSTRRTVAIAVGLALAVNLILLGAFFWSRGGQTTHVRVEVRDSAFTAYIDGRLHAKARFAAPAAGGLVLSVRDTGLIPSLPVPRGIDYVRVTDLDSGEILFEDDFSQDPLLKWTEVQGNFASDDGVIGVDGEGALVLQENWRDYAVDLKYKNITEASVILRAQDRWTGVSFNFRLFKNYDSGFVLVEDGQVIDSMPGALTEPKRSAALKSVVNMSVKGYPFVLLGLAAGLGAVVALLLADTALRRIAGVLGQIARVPERGLPRIRSLSPPGWLGGALTRIAPAMPWFVAGGIAAGAFGIALFLLYAYGDAMPHVQDSVAYVFQARFFAEGRIAVPPPPVEGAFDFERPPFVVVSDGKWASVYPFGHPLLLAIGLRVGALWLIPPLIGGASVLLVFAIGRRVYGTRVGLLAAVLLASSPFFFMTASNFMSHNTGAFYLLSALFFLTFRDRRPLFFGVLAGLSFGLLFNTRPLAALALMPTLGLFLLLDVLAQERRLVGVRRAAGFGAGALAMAAAYLLYNFGTTGDPFTSGFGASGFNQSLGFGGGHTVVLGIQNVQAQMAALLLVFNGWPQYVGLAFVLLPFVLGTRERWDWMLLASALLVITAYVFYVGHGISHGPRYWYVVTPLLILLVARGADRAAILLASGASSVVGTVMRPAGRPVWAGILVVYSLVLVLIGGSINSWLLGTDATWFMDFVPNRAVALQSYNGVDDRLLVVIEDADLEDALVLVEGPCPWQCYGSVFLLNSPTLDGDIVIVKDDPERRAEVFAAYPDRRVYLATYVNPTLRPYGSPAISPESGVSFQRSPVPLAREIALPTPTPTPPPPTPDPTEALGRDEQRREDLASIAEALQAYYERHGSYPLAEGLQSFCAFRDLDAGCKVEEFLDPLPHDPSSDRVYSYLSDGRTFALFALLEGSGSPSQCPDFVPQALESVDYLYCVQGPETDRPADRS